MAVKEASALQGLRVRKLADSERNFAGLQIEGEIAAQTLLPVSFVVRGQGEGWLELENPSMVFRPGGPREEPWRVTHTFTHADAVVLHTVAGDVRYRVLSNPDKWPESKNEQDEGFGGEVRWFYHLELEN